MNNRTFFIQHNVNLWNLLSLDLAAVEIEMILYQWLLVMMGNTAFMMRGKWVHPVVFLVGQNNKFLFSRSNA